MIEGLTNDCRGTPKAASAIAGFSFALFSQLPGKQVLVVATCIPDGLAARRGISEV
ncbi:MAG: hypothetical protein M3145_06215 [Pseudomonadota bacterium]|nr:hypothetical protein [Pseudomonadota bacterium]